MTKSKNIIIFASLYLGASLVGGTDAGAAPLSTMPTSIQSDDTAKNLTNKSDVKKTGLLLGLGIGALVGGVLVHKHGHYFNYRHYKHRHQGGKFAPWSHAWKKNCSRRYRSFNPKTGYYNTRRHGRVFCK